MNENTAGKSGWSVGAMNAVRPMTKRNIDRMLASCRLYPHAVLHTDLVPQPVAQAVAEHGDVGDANNANDEAP